LKCSFEIWEESVVRASNPVHPLSAVDCKAVDVTSNRSFRQTWLSINKQASRHLRCSYWGRSVMTELLLLLTH